MTRHSFGEMFTFTRAGPASYWDDAAGVMRFVGNDVPRIDSEGIIMEGVSTNIVDYSSVTTSNDIGAATTRTDISGKFGFSHGLKIANSVSNLSAYGGSQATGTMAAGTRWTGSWYFEPGPTNTVRIRVDNGGGAVANASGIVGDSFVVSGDGAWSENREYTMTDMGGGLWFMTLSFDVLQDMTTPRCLIGAWNSEVGAYIDLYAMQLENLPFATSHIETTGTAVERAADSLTAAAGPLGTDYQTGGTWLVEAIFERAIGTSDTTRVLNYGDSTGRPFVLFSGVEADVGTMQCFDGTTTFSRTAGPAYNAAFKSYAVSWVNGGTRTLSNAGISASGSSDADGFGTELPMFGDGNFYGHIKRAIYWPEPLTEDDLNAMTEYTGPPPVAVQLPHLPDVPTQLPEVPDTDVV